MVMVVVVRARDQTNACSNIIITIEQQSTRQKKRRGQRNNPRVYCTVQYLSCQAGKKGTSFTHITRTEPNAACDAKEITDNAYNH